MVEWREVVALLHGSRDAGKIAAETLAEFPFFSNLPTGSVTEVFHGMTSFPLFAFWMGIHLKSSSLHRNSDGETD